MLTSDIDDLDKQILKLLQLDARIPFAELSRKLDVAEATIRFRVNKLVEKGIITNFTALIDPAKVGMKVSGAILLKIDPAYLEEACKQLMSFKETQYLFQSTGEYDVVSVIITWNILVS
jgi:Lrp/AsnC family transcriptional regulator for asnA, asnC and gidA